MYLVRKLLKEQVTCKIRYAYEVMMSKESLTTAISCSIR